MLPVINLLYIDDQPEELRLGYQLLEGISDYDVRVTSTRAPLADINDYSMYDIVVFDHDLKMARKGSSYALDAAKAHPGLPVYLYSGASEKQREFSNLLYQGLDGILYKGKNDETVEQLYVAFRHITRVRFATIERRKGFDRRKENN